MLSGFELYPRWVPLMRYSGSWTPLSSTESPFQHNTRTPAMGFPLNTLKTLFRLSKVLLDV